MISDPVTETDVIKNVKEKDQGAEKEIGGGRGKERGNGSGKESENVREKETENVSVTARGKEKRKDGIDMKLTGGETGDGISLGINNLIIILLVLFYFMELYHYYFLAFYI